MPCRRLLAQLPTPTMPIAIFPILAACLRGRHVPAQEAPHITNETRAVNRRPAGQFYFLRKPEGALLRAWMSRGLSGRGGSRGRRAAGSVRGDELGELAKEPAHRMVRLCVGERSPGIPGLAQRGHER